LSRASTTVNLAVLSVSTLLDQSSSRLPFARANSIFSLCYYAVLSSSFVSSFACLYCSYLHPCCRYVTFVFTLPQSLSSRHPGSRSPRPLCFRHLIGVAVRSCICPTPCSIKRLISAALLRAFPNHNPAIVTIS